LLGEDEMSQLSGFYCSWTHARSSTYCSHASRKMCAQTKKIVMVFST